MYGEPETGDVIHLHKAIEHFDNLYIRSAASTEEKKVLNIKGWEEMQ